ncbi:hypothetical protein AOLI_G00124020 [Acnodon oligacanthus]
MEEQVGQEQNGQEKTATDGSPLYCVPPIIVVQAPSNTRKGKLREKFPKRQSWIGGLLWGIQCRVAGTSQTCLIYDVSPWTEGSRAQVLEACVMVRGVEWKLSPGGKRRSRDLLYHIND